MPARVNLGVNAGDALPGDIFVTGYSDTPNDPNSAELVYLVHTAGGASSGLIAGYGQTAGVREAFARIQIAWNALGAAFSLGAGSSAVDVTWRRTGVSASSITGSFTIANGLTVTAGDILAAGSLGSTGARLVKGWFTDLQTTNFISGPGVSGSAATLTNARTFDGQSFDGSANVLVIAPGTHAASSKTTPVDADELPLVDSAASNVLKKLTWANLKAALGVETTIANHITNVALISNTTEQNVWSDSIPLATLTTNGDKVEGWYHLDLASNTHTKQVGVDVAGTRIVNLSTATAVATELAIDIKIIRVSNTVIRVRVTYSTNGTVSASWNAAPGYQEITGLNLTTTAYNVNITGQNVTNASTTDIIGRMGNVRVVPA